MSSSDLAISVRGLGKSYTIARQGAGAASAREALAGRLRRPFARPERETFWALRDVSFDVPRGEVVGLIGRNGAGKSTLLKVMSRITEPTEGEVRLWGRVGSLLEVGTGFHPELTGRENIFLNGAILGMSRREIARQFDAIVDFSGVERFLDTPVKRYSSGMYVRLAFAVAAHLESEILLVDEVLAVGDIEFQKKCLGKMQDVSRSGRTVLFVSHSMQSVSVLCTRAVFLQSGEVVHSGDVERALDLYMRRDPSAPPEPAQARRGTGEYRFEMAEPTKERFEGHEAKEVRFRARRYAQDSPRLYLAAHIVNEAGIILAQCDSRLYDVWLPPDEVLEGVLRVSTPWLKPGTYSVDLFVCAPGQILDAFEQACVFEVSPVLPYPHALSSDGYDKGAVFSEFDWHVGARQGVGA